jgi:DNA-binding transcriptional MerR regulator
MTLPEKYTAADLARLAGVTLRTVRFYLREGLIDRPAGRGPGAHFDQKHLHQLMRIRALQEAGLDNAAIRRHGDDLDRILTQTILTEKGREIANALKLWPALTLSSLASLGAAAHLDPDEDDDDGPDPAMAIRIPLAPEITLLVGPDVPMPSPKRLVELAFFVRRIFKLS